MEEKRKERNDDLKGVDDFFGDDGEEEEMHGDDNLAAR